MRRDTSRARMVRAMRNPALELGMLLALLAGCASVEQSQPPQQAPSQSKSPAPAAQVNLTGFPPSFRDGYADGCESASARRERRQESRYKTEDDYKRGWNDGHSACQPRSR